MAYYGRRSTASSILDAFSLSPLPYPVLLILGVASIFVGISWYFSYDSVVETAEEQLNWVLFAIPVILLLIICCLSSMENPGALFATSPWDRRRRTHNQPAEGSSPWGVAAFIVLILVMLHYKSVFRDSWLI